MKIKVTLLLLFGIWTGVSAQQYLKSAGLRMGHTPGISFQKFVKENQAFDLMVSGRHKGIQFNAMYKWHSPAQFDFTDQVVLYYGIGGHFGIERFFPHTLEYERTIPELYLNRRSYFSMGADIVVGFEYRMLVAPLTLSFDVKPYINYIGFRELDGHFWDSAISIKYVFNH